MSLQKKFIVGGYDTHGTSTSVVIGRSQKIPLDNILVRFPDTSPENLPKFLYTQNLFNDEIYVVDIGINIKNPSEFIDTMKIIADNNVLTFIDHHETNYQYLSLMPKGIRFLQFPSASSMAKAVADMFNAKQDWDLLVVGSIGDRDSSIKEITDVGSMYFERLYRLANIMDVLVRKNVGETIKGLYQDGIEYLERQADNVKYPPSELADIFASEGKITRYGNIVVVDATNIQQNMASWLWKTFDEILRRHGADYLIAPAKVLDRQLNRYVDVVFVIKYWLSDMAPAKQLIPDIINNRRVIGHDDAFSISASSPQDAQELAKAILDRLQENYSVTASYIPTGNVARALQEDFRRILNRQTEVLQKITEILELQQQNYAKYNELKEEQIQMLKRVTNADVHRAD